MAKLVLNPYPVFTDIDGMPIEDGYVSITAVGGAPLQAYWDIALTEPADDIRTKGGYALNGSAIGVLYAAEQFTITVKNRKDKIIYAAADSFVDSEVTANTIYKDRVKTKVLWTGPLSIATTPTSLDGGEKFSDWDMVVFNVSLLSDVSLIGTTAILDMKISQNHRVFSNSGEFVVNRLTDTTFQIDSKTVSSGNIQRIIGIKL